MFTDPEYHFIITVPVTHADNSMVITVLHRRKLRESWCLVKSARQQASN